MRRLAPAAAVVLMLTLLGSLAGCVETKYALVVYPDGSGKIHVESRSAGKEDAFSMQLEMLEGLKELSEEVYEETKQQIDKQYFEMIGQKYEGLSAWTLPKIEKKRGKAHLGFTGYFDDVNQLRIRLEPEDAGSAETFAFEKKADGTYAFRSGLHVEVPEKDLPPDDWTEAEKRADIKEFEETFEGLKLLYEVRLPGEATGGKGVKTRGRKATYQIGVDFLVAMKKEQFQDPRTEFDKVTGAVTGMAEGEELAAELAEFRVEAEAAKKDWVALEESFEGVTGLGE